MLTLPEMRTVLQQVAYPATREEILLTLAAQDMPEEFLTRLRKLPEYRYGSVDTVMDALRGMG